MGRPCGVALVGGQCPSLSSCEPGFFEYLRGLDASGVEVEALKEGAIAFPRVTLIKVNPGSDLIVHTRRRRRGHTTF